MKNNLKLSFFLSFMLIFGLVFSCKGFNIQDLQPALAIVYNEPIQINSGLTVKGVAYFPAGVHIGQQGTGGVTFVNGTIVNATTDGGDNPVTFGDNVRIDGRIWRGAIAGPGDKMPLSVLDDMYLQGALTLDSNIILKPGKTVDGVDISELKVKNIRDLLATASELNVTSGGIYFGELLGSATDAQIPDTITVSRYLPLSGGTMTGHINMNGKNILNIQNLQTQNLKVGSLNGILKAALGQVSVAGPGIDYEYPLIFQNSLKRTGNIINLINDEDSPGISKYYGTDDSGEKGFFNLPVSFWEDVGSGNITNTNTGNVGIGTNVPSAKLEIQDATNPIFIQLLSQNQEGALIKFIPPTKTGGQGPPWVIGATGPGSSEDSRKFVIRDESGTIMAIKAGSGVVIGRDYTSTQPGPENGLLIQGNTMIGGTETTPPLDPAKLEIQGQGDANHPWNPLLRVYSQNAYAALAVQRANETGQSAIFLGYVDNGWIIEGSRVTHPTLTFLERLKFMDDSGGAIATILKTGEGKGNVGIMEDIPKSRLEVNGSFATAIKSVTSDTTLTEDDFTVLADASSGKLQITLPNLQIVSPIRITGRVYVIKKVDPKNNVEIVPNPTGPTATIDGQTSLTLYSQWESVTLQTDGNDWFIIDHYTP